MEQTVCATTMNMEKRAVLLQERLRHISLSLMDLAAIPGHYQS
jgi:hypothetical protein